MSVRLTPRQSQCRARLADMLETVRRVKGDAFHAVAYSAVQARLAMAMFDRSEYRASFERRSQVAAELMRGVRELSTTLSLPPGQLAEALRHARTMYREGFER